MSENNLPQQTNIDQSGSSSQPQSALQQPNHSKPWWSPSRNKLLVLISIVVLTSVVVGGVLLLNQDTDISQDIPKKEEEVAIQSSSAPKIVDNQKPKVISLELLSFDKDQPDEIRANNRIEMLTNGLSVSKINEIVDNKAEQNQPSPSNKLTQVPESSVDQVKAAQLVKQNQVNDLSIWYTKSEEYYKPNGFEPVKKNPLFEPSKPFIRETWSSANNYKNIDSQAGNVFDMWISTPSYDLEYKGGKYAIRRDYQSLGYFNGMGYGMQEQYQNRELEFYKSIIESDYLQKAEPITRDGKTYQVYTANYSETELYRYLVDPEFFKIEYGEYVQAGEIISYSKFILDNYQEINSIEDVFNTKEIANKEIKAIKSERYYGYDIESNLQEDYKKYVDKYSLVSSIDLADDNLEIYIHNQDDQYLELLNSADFDPSFDPKNNSYFANMLDVTVYDFSKSNYYSIFDSSQDVQDFVKIYYGDQKIVTKEVDLSIDGKKIEATAYSNLLEGEQDQGYSSFTNIIFNYNNKHYFYPYLQEQGSNPLQISLSLKLISPQQLLEIAERMDKKNNSVVRLSPVESISKIPESIRYVSSVVTKESQKWRLNSVVTPTKTPDQSTCADYITYVYGLVDCLVEKHSGAGFEYWANFDDPDYSKSYLISVYILDTKNNSLDIEKECTKYLATVCKIVTVDGVKALSYDQPVDSYEGALDFIMPIAEVDGQLVLYYAGIDADQTRKNEAKNLVSALSKDFDKASIDKVLSSGYFGGYMN
jgi:hypothetical protein